MRIGQVSGRSRGNAGSKYDQSVHESRIERAKFPVLDFHSHITTSAKSENGVEWASEVKYLGTPEELLAVMDRKNIWATVKLPGGYGKGLGNVINQYDRAFPGCVVRIQAKTLQSDCPPFTDKMLGGSPCKGLDG